MTESPSSTIAAAAVRLSRARVARQEGAGSTHRRVETPISAVSAATAGAAGVAGADNPASPAA